MNYFWLSNLLTLLVSACSTPSAKQASSPIYVRWLRDPETRDPLTIPNASAVAALKLLPAPPLAVDYQTMFALALDYELRPAATRDDGRPVLAADVAFTLKLLQCPGLPNESNRAEMDFIRQVRLDPAYPRRFTLVCRGQGAEIPTMAGDFFVFPEAALDSAHTLRRLPLATLLDWPPTRAPIPTILAIPAEGGDPRRQRLLRRRLQVLLREEIPLLSRFFLPYCRAVSRQLQHVVTSGIKPGYAVTALSWPAAPTAAGPH